MVKPVSFNGMSDNHILKLISLSHNSASSLCQIDILIMSITLRANETQDIVDSLRKSIKMSQCIIRQVFTTQF